MSFKLSSTPLGVSIPQYAFRGRKFAVAPSARIDSLFRALCSVTADAVSVCLLEVGLPTFKVVSKKPVVLTYSSHSSSSATTMPATAIGSGSIPIVDANTCLLFSTGVFLVAIGQKLYEIDRTGLIREHELSFPSGVACVVSMLDISDDRVPDTLQCLAISDRSEFLLLTFRSHDAVSMQFLEHRVGDVDTSRAYRSTVDPRTPASSKPALLGAASGSAGPRSTPNVSSIVKSVASLIFTPFKGRTPSRSLLSDIPESASYVEGSPAKRPRLEEPSSGDVSLFSSVCLLGRDTMIGVSRRSVQILRVVDERGSGSTSAISLTTISDLALEDVFRKLPIAEYGSREHVAVTVKQIHSAFGGRVLILCRLSTRLDVSWAVSSYVLVNHELRFESALPLPASRMLTDVSFVNGLNDRFVVLQAELHVLMFPLSSVVARSSSSTAFSEVTVDSKSAVVLGSTGEDIASCSFLAVESGSAIHHKFGFQSLSEATHVAYIATCLQSIAEYPAHSATMPPYSLLFLDAIAISPRVSLKAIESFVDTLRRRQIAEVSEPLTAPMGEAALLEGAQLQVSLIAKLLYRFDHDSPNLSPKLREAFSLATLPAALHVLSEFVSSRLQFISLMNAMIESASFKAWVVSHVGSAQGLGMLSMESFYGSTVQRFGEKVRSLVVTADSRRVIDVFQLASFVVTSMRTICTRQEDVEANRSLFASSVSFSKVLSECFNKSLLLLQQLATFKQGYSFFSISCFLNKLLLDGDIAIPDAMLVSYVHAHEDLLSKCVILDVHDDCVVIRDAFHTLLLLCARTRHLECRDLLLRFFLDRQILTSSCNEFLHLEDLFFDPTVISLPDVQRMMTDDDQFSDLVCRRLVNQGNIRILLRFADHQLSRTVLTHIAMSPKLGHLSHLFAAKFALWDVSATAERSRTQSEFDTHLLQWMDEVR